MARTGRRPGRTSTRAVILAAARQHFGASGYAATSLRAIAADAGVDVRVVLHFFDSKAGLFRAVVGWPFDPQHVQSVLAVDEGAGMGERLARTFFDYWRDPSTAQVLAALMRSAMTHAEAATLLREFVAHQLFAPLAGSIGGSDADVRVDLAAGHLVGVALLRYILQVEPIASTDTDDLVARLTPVLEGYLQPVH
jgi:AcrR family transcriptional regulator